NEELLTSHFNAFLLMELGIGELHSSVADVLKLENTAAIAVKESIIASLENSLRLYKTEWIASFRKVIQAMEPELARTYWYTDSWLEKKLESFSTRFQAAFKRWIVLYQSALYMMDRAHAIQQDPTYRSDSPEKKDANRQYAVAAKQLALLRNDANQSGSNESEFYVFRYLAAEGFLPGYNFTRLPVRTFVGYKHSNQGEYISRPRAVALREFGPLNTVYHNGSKYRINRMTLMDAASLQRKVKLSLETGYAFLDEEAEMANVDPITEKPLRNSNNAEYRTNLIELSESEGVPVERISCIEEERSTSKYQIKNYFRYPQGINHTKSALIQQGNT
ncbi:MAG: hypothetical protein ACK5XN_28075, partial [Bacteroidota bacterium]